MPTLKYNCFTIPRLFELNLVFKVCNYMIGGTLIQRFQRLSQSNTRMSDILLPREAGKFIAENSKHVFIKEDGIQNLAQKMLDKLIANPKAMDVERWDLHILNPKTKDQSAIDWVFLADVLNFSFWSDDEDNKYAVTYSGQSWTGYWSLCAVINRALDEGIPIADPKYYSSITMDQLNHVFRSDTPINMPMMEKRLEHLHEAGKVLVEKYGGTFSNVVKAADQSAQKLLKLVVEDFPSFRDVAEFEGKQVAIYKRVQILIGDIWAACGGKGHGTFTDIDTITMFADYRIPQALMWFGALKYSDELMEKLNKSYMFTTGEREEVEIRGCSIWATELARTALQSLVDNSDKLPTKVHINAIILDHFLWDFRRDHAAETRHIPIHKIRSVFY